MTNPLDQQQEQLLTRQYADSGNLDARATLHRRFSTNTVGWHTWVFDQLELAPAARILELGCGPGWLWHNNQERISPDWQITLTDFSPGMVDEARANMDSSARGTFTFEQCDAQNLPFEEAAFDAVIANHMLYHVPDIPQALREVHRVLQPGGRFYAATNGTQHMQEIREIGNHLAPEEFENIRRNFKGNSFDLETGTELLADVFPSVAVRRYPDGLVVTETEPLVAYIVSMAPDELRTTENITLLRAYIARQIATTGAINITKDSGLFIAQKA